MRVVTLSPSHVKLNSCGPQSGGRWPLVKGQLMFVRSPQEKYWLQFGRLIMSLEGNDAVKWRNNKRVERKEVAAAVLRGCIGGGIRRA